MIRLIQSVFYNIYIYINLYYRDKLYFGVTNISKWPAEHELISDFSTLDESFHAMSCSMRIFPFFCCPAGLYKNKVLIDGGFSKMFSVPYDQDKSKIIYVTPVPSNIVKADIQPNVHSYPYQTFKLKHFFQIPTLEWVFEQFTRGYNDAMKSRYILINKGIPIKKELNGCFQYKLDTHLEMLKKYSSIIFKNNNGNSHEYTKFKQSLKNIYQPKLY